MARRKKGQTEKKSGRASYIFPALITLFGFFISPYLGYQYGLHTQMTISNKQKRQQSYTELMGNKSIIRQLYVSHGESILFFEYYQNRWRIEGTPKESIIFQEAIHNLRKAEGYSLEIAKTNQKIFETIGLIRTSFANSQKLNELTERIYRLNPPQVLGDPSKMDINELEAWKNKAIKNLQIFVEREYSEPIDQLLTYLATEIAKDSQ